MDDGQRGRVECFKVHGGLLMTKEEGGEVGRCGISGLRHTYGSPNLSHDVIVRRPEP